MRAALATSNADRDLTSEVAVFSAVVDANAPQLVIADVVLGDGTKNLDGTGGDFTLKVEIGGVLFDGATQTKSVDSGETRARFQTTQLLIPTNVTLAVKVTSPNGADTDVDCTATVYDASPLQPTTLNNKATVDSSGKVTLADGVTHGGTTAKLRLGSNNSTPAFYATNSNGEAFRVEVTSGVSNAFRIVGGGIGLRVDGSNGSSGVAFIGSGGAATLGSYGLQIDGTTGDLIGNITGSLSGSIGSVGTDGIDADALAADALAAINAEVVDVITVDTSVAGVTVAEALRRIGTITSGEVSGARSGTETFTDWADSANTIVITVDTSGNRSAIVYN